MAIGNQRSHTEALHHLKRASSQTFKINFTLLFAKYYLYTQKLLKEEINLKEFIRKLTSKLQIEKLS